MLYKSCHSLSHVVPSLDLSKKLSVILVIPGWMPKTAKEKDQENFQVNWKSVLPSQSTTRVQTYLLNFYFLSTHIPAKMNYSFLPMLISEAPTFCDSVCMSWLSLEVFPDSPQQEVIFWAYLALLVPLIWPLFYIWVAYVLSFTTMFMPK